MKNRILILGAAIALLVGGVVYFQSEIRMVVAKEFFSRASNYFSAENYALNKAKNWYQKTLTIYPKLPNTHYQLARIYFVKSDFEKALKEINTELSLNPKNQRSYYIRGLINAYRGDYQAAISDFEKFITWSPNEWAGYTDLAWVYYQKGDYQKAKEVLLVALKKHPNNAWLWNGLGVVYSKLGDSYKFQKAVNKATELSRNLTIADYKRAYPGNDPRWAEADLERFKNKIAIGGTFIPACSASIYYRCLGKTCVGVICDPDHETCANTCANNINCGALPTVNLSGPDIVEIPDSVWLNWSVLDAESCWASGEWSGSKSVSGGSELIWASTTPALRGNHNFNLTCSNRNGSVSDAHTVKVIQAPRCTFTANPTSIIPPGTSTLSWSCQYADSCSIDQGIGSVNPVSGTKSVRPTQSTTYTLTCASLDVSRSYQATVNVGFQPRLREVIPH